MERLTGVFVNNPALIFLISGLFFFAYLLLQNSKSVSRPKALLWGATAWAIWAVWEFCVTRFSPEANIRVDLLVILPLVLIASVWGIVRSLMAR